MELKVYRAQRSTSASVRAKVTQTDPYILVCDQRLELVASVK